MIAGANAARRRFARNASTLLGGAVLLVVVVVSLLAPWLGTIDPARIEPSMRNRKPGTEVVLRGDDGTRTRRTATFGTDPVGRDIYSRVLYGARVSLLVGAAVALLSAIGGLAVGVAAGYFRGIDLVLMRLMDGLMAIPGIMFAIGLVAVMGPGIATVIAAITITDVPRVARLVRSVVLSAREAAYVEAAVSVGTPTLRLLRRHILPTTVAPLLVQATFICASAMLVEATLSFLGIGIDPEVPSWGNIMAEGRPQFLVQPHNIAFPAAALATTVLAVNMLGDGLRDLLDPRLARRL
ncbi:MAG: ABC transporter permease [Alphaproteobacteria bacterium]|nr:ABC transporter permease [Alphaproteobacteria bacterium]